MSISSLDDALNLSKIRRVSTLCWPFGNRVERRDDRCSIQEWQQFIDDLSFENVSPFLFPLSGMATVIIKLEGRERVCVF